MNDRKTAAPRIAIGIAALAMTVLTFAVFVLLSATAEAATLQSTYFGGANDEAITAVAVHPVSGDVFVAGYTNSANLPCTGPGNGCAAGAQPAKAAGTDGFVARLNPNLTQLLQVTYFGGSGSDQINALAIHPATGEVLIAGTTDSTDLPCVSVNTGCGNAGQPQNAGSTDGFVARLNPQLTQILQVTYAGGAGVDQINAIAINPANGEVLVAGSTDSPNLPCTGNNDGCNNGAQIAIAGGEDGFVVRFSADLTSLLRSTYLGGFSTDRIFAIAVHPMSGEVLVAGSTQSNDLKCTTVLGLCGKGAQDKIAGDQDGFVARLTPNIARLIQATYLGSPGSDGIFALVVHPQSGEVLVAGATGTDLFPCTTTGGGCSAGGQSHLAGGQDGFVARLNPNLTELLQATYLGGTGFDQIYALAVHPSTGEILVAGQTASTDLPCTTSAIRCGAGALGANDGSFSGFVSRFDASLTGLLQSTYVGGAGTDIIAAIAVHPTSGEVIVAGNTTSTDLPCTVAAGLCGNGAQKDFSGGLSDGFATQFSPDLTLGDTTPNAIAFAAQSGAPVSSLRTSAPVQVSGIDGPAQIYVEGQLGSAYCISTAANCSCNVTLGFVTDRRTIDDGQFVCVRHVSAPIANEVTRTTFHAGGGAGTFHVATGTPFGAGGGCSLDVDGNNAIDALTDGMLIMRAMFGFTGTAVTQGAVGANATRGDWAAIRAYLNGNCGLNLAQ